LWADSAGAENRVHTGHAACSPSWPRSPRTPTASSAQAASAGAEMVRGARETFRGVPAGHHRPEQPDGVADRHPGLPADARGDAGALPALFHQPPTPPCPPSHVTARPSRDGSPGSTADSPIRSCGWSRDGCRRWPSSGTAVESPDPRLVDSDEGSRLVPVIVRGPFRLLRVGTFIRLKSPAPPQPHRRDPSVARDPALSRKEERE